MRTVIVSGKKLQVPSSSDDWELYDMPGVTNAVDELNSEVDHTIERWTAASNDGQFAPTHRAFSFAEKTWFGPILQKHRDFGALDTEPSANVCNVLRTITKAMDTATAACNSVDQRDTLVSEEEKNHAPCFLAFHIGILGMRLRRIVRDECARGSLVQLRSTGGGNRHPLRGVRPDGDARVDDRDELMASDRLPPPVRLIQDTEDQVQQGMAARGMVLDQDYTIEDGRVVYSESHLRKRGWCCNHRCRNCPWREK